MPWAKGQTGNPLGRPAFTARDEIQKQLKKRKKDLIQEIFEHIDNLEEPSQKLHYLFKLMDFMYSRPREIEIPLDHAIQIVKSFIAESKRVGGDASTALPEPTQSV